VRSVRAVLPSRPMANQTIRVGFIGAGKNTRERHIPGFQTCEGVEFVAVANRSTESGERVAKEFGIARVYGDWRELLKAPDVDAVCIGTWPYAHREISEASLAVGKHVLCEARMAMNAAEGRSMLAASRKAPNLVAQLVPAPQSLEVDPTIMRLLAEGYVGEVLSLELQAAQGRFVEPDAPLHWRQNIALSGGNVLTMGIWYETVMRWLGPARRVMAMTKVAVPRRRDEIGALHEVKVPDHVDILVTFAGGAVGHMRFSSITALGPASEAWIFGTSGTLRLEVDARRLSGGQRGDKALSEVVIPKEQRIGWRVEQEFVNAIRGHEKITHTSFEDGVRYMEFTDAVAKSAATGQAVEVAEL
ncbi:MAG: Gfo/Idh/MocA family protein, partial [Candidatus Rokuibacteriota bacterium]